MSRKKRATSGRRVLKWGLLFPCVILALTLLEVLMVGFLNPPFTVSMLRGWVENGGRLQHSLLHQSWYPLEKISPHLRKAVLAAEDQRFLSHRGFDFTELNKAIKDMAMKRGYRGASTISMQVARTVFLWPERSLLRKAAESYFTLLIECFWPKQRILEVYLNTVDWGTGIMGAEEASRRYLGISCEDLSPSQAAILAAVLPNPHRWSPRNPNAHVLKRQKRILKDLKKMPLV